jgi:hypothetical protein
VVKIFGDFPFVLSLVEAFLGFFSRISIVMANAPPSEIARKGFGNPVREPPGGAFPAHAKIAPAGDLFRHAETRLVKHNLIFMGRRMIDHFAAI